MFVYCTYERRAAAEKNRRFIIILLIMVPAFRFGGDVTPYDIRYIIFKKKKNFADHDCLSDI